MAKHQTRRSISVSRDAYDALQAKCRGGDASMSAVVERFIRRHCSLPPDTVQRRPPYQRRARLLDPLEIVGVRFTSAQASPDMTAVERRLVAQAAELERIRAENEREERIWANPCRRERCPNAHTLHEAHD